MNYGKTIRIYLAGLFVLLCSNAVSALFALVGIHGIAFYHLQAVLLLVCLVHVGTLTLRGQISIATDQQLFILVLLSITYTVLSALLLLRFSDVRLPYVALMLYTFLVYPVMSITMAGCARAGESASTAFNGFPRWMVAVAAFILLFGWAQFGYQDNILQVTNSENVSKMVAASVLGTFRPPSVFVSSLLFGLFSVFIYCICAGYILTGHGSRTVYLLAILAFASAVLSQTRNVYLCAAFATATMFFLRGSESKWKLRVIRKLPVFYLAVASLVLLWAVWQFVSSGLQKTGDLADTSSTWARVSGWQAAWESLVRPGSLFDLLFGYGISQAGQASDFASLYPARGDGLFIDSTFFNLFLFQGIIGLLFFIAIYWTLWRGLLRRAAQFREPVTTGLACFVSAFLAVGVLNIVSGQWWGIVISLSFLTLAPNYRKLTCAA